jgi:hypothetical protein
MAAERVADPADDAAPPQSKATVFAITTPLKNNPPATNFKNVFIICVSF